MTKKQARQRRIDWNTAIAEGRVMCSQRGLSHASFATRADALAAVARVQLAGMEADIVDPSLADFSSLVRAQFPGVEYIATVGWCGPDWKAATAFEQQLRAQTVHS